MTTITVKFEFLTLVVFVYKTVIFEVYISVLQMAEQTMKETFSCDGIAEGLLITYSILLVYAPTSRTCLAGKASGE